jgi:UDP-N-acetylglucosamine 2-epimerase (non-hydrolysing)
VRCYGKLGFATDKCAPALDVGKKDRFQGSLIKRRRVSELKVSIVLGTRPEIIKLSPVIRQCEHLGLHYFILHSGQHYSYNMDRVFFQQLELPDAKHNLDVGSGSHGEQTGKMLIGIERILSKEKPDIVLVEGDTNTVLAGALAAVKLDIRVGHVEAGLRSYDRHMPEEINRILADHCSDFLFAPTEKSKQTLLSEGVAEEKIFVTGNTVVDAVFQNLEISKARMNVIDEMGLKGGEYFLATVHRQENVDDETRLHGIIDGLERVKEQFNVELVYPIHPRAAKRLKEFGLELKDVTLVEPLDYLGFLQLESNAKLVLTDSGGVQEETCILGVPCVTLRDNTERPETVDVGSNVLAGSNPDRIVEMAKFMLNKDRNWSNPFGDGNAGKRIVKILDEESQT